MAIYCSTNGTDACPMSKNIVVNVPTAQEPDISPALITLGSFEGRPYAQALSNANIRVEVCQQLSIEPSPNTDSPARNSQEFVCAANALSGVVFITMEPATTYHPPHEME